jgi:hypothetical protein
MTPSARSLKECRKRGWTAEKVEHRLPRGFTTIDLFGFGDVIALDGKPGSLLIQATTTSHAPARVAKIQTDCFDKALAWLRAGNRIVVWGWAKRGERGKRKLWTLKEYPLDLATLTFAGDVGVVVCLRGDEKND